MKTSGKKTEGLHMQTDTSDQLHLIRVSQGTLIKIHDQVDS